MLLHNRHAGEYLLNAAHEAFDFHAMLDDVPKTSVATPFQYTELEVTNIPSEVELPRSEIERRLEELAKAWHGKVKFMSSQGTAVLKFENGDKANRALKIMQGELVGKRPIQVNFNKRLNFVNNKRSESKSPAPGQAFGGRRRPVAEVRAFSTTSNELPSARALAGETDFLNNVNSDEGDEDDDGEVFVIDVVEEPENAIAASFPVEPKIDQRKRGPLPKGVFLPLCIERDLNSQRRKVKSDGQRDNDNGSRNDEDAYDSTTTTSSGRPESLNGRPKKQSRRRRSRRRNRSTEDIEERLDLVSVSDGNADVIDVPPPVVVVVGNIVTQAKETAVKSALGAALSERRAFYTAISVERVRPPAPNDDESIHYECRIDFEEVDTAQKVVDFMSAFPYGREKLAPRFQDPLDGVKARLLEIIKDDPADAVSLQDLKLKYRSKFGPQDTDSITVGRLNSIAQLEVRNLGGFEVTVALRTRLHPKYAAAIQLPLPLAASLDTSYIHPCVHTTLENLKERLRKAMETFAPYGIPYSKILLALNATAAVNDQGIGVMPAERGGVPLEQLMEATGMIKLERDSYGEYKFVPKDANHVKASGSAEVKKIERQVSMILNETPYHRMKRSELERKFRLRHGNTLEAVCRPFGGACKILGTDENSVMRSSFSVIGVGDAAEVIMSHARQKTIFMLCIRKILAAIDDAGGSDLGNKTLEAGRFAELYEAVLSKGRRVRIARFGVCTLSCMWSALRRTKQSLVSLREESVKYSPEFVAFLKNSQIIFSTEMISTEEFDLRYCRKFGAYRISAFTFSSIKECFDELPGFCVCGRTGFIGQSAQARIKLLTHQIFNLLLHSPEGKLTSKQLYSTYLRQYYLDLEEAMTNLDMRDIEAVCSKFPPKTGIVCTRFGETELVYLSESTFISNFEKRVVALLYQQPTRGFTSMDHFLTAYARCYSPECFLSVAHMEKNMLGRVLVNLEFADDNGLVGGGVFLTPGVVAVVDLAQRLLYNGSVSVTGVEDPGRMREWIRLISGVRKQLHNLRSALIDLVIKYSLQGGRVQRRPRGLPAEPERWRLIFSIATPAT